MQTLPSPPVEKGPIGIAALGLEKCVKKLKFVAHWGFVPLVLYLGFQSDPQPTLLQLILPI